MHSSGVTAKIQRFNENIALADITGPHRIALPNTKLKVFDWSVPDNFIVNILIQFMS